jgi:hypothetical protein
VTWQVWVGAGGLMVAAGLALLGYLAFWKPGPPIGEEDPGISWLASSGERPYVGRRRAADVEIHPDPVEDLRPTGHAEEWMWRPGASPPPRQWQRPPWT